MALVVKTSPSATNAGTSGDLSLIPESGRSPGRGGMAYHSSTLAWRIPGAEEPGGLLFIESQSQT